MRPLTNEICSNCGKPFDPTMGECPSCHKAGAFFSEKEKFQNESHVGLSRNIWYFLIGLLGFQIIAVILSVMIQTAFIVEQGGEVATEDLVAFATMPKSLLIVNGGSYIILVTILLLLSIGRFQELFKTFKTPKNMGMGVLFGFAMIAFSIVWGTIASAISPSQTVDPSANQSTLNIMIGDYPVISFIIFGLIGPFCEEVTYRVGLFSLTSRFNKIAAYIVAALVFSLIHFDFDSIGTETFINELLNLPSYLFAGIMFSFIYDKYGLAGSLTAHCVNNLISILITVL